MTAPAITAVRPLVGAMTFEENWSIPCAPNADFIGVYPRWTPHFYFGNPNDLTSRDYPGTLSCMTDTRFDPAARTLQSNGSVLILNAYKTPVGDLGKYNNNPYLSAVLTTKDVFSQAFGYFEISARLPAVPGSWPAGWLLPDAKNSTNLGRLAEFDMFEHYGGPITVQSGSPPQPFVIDRCGRPFSTLHYGVAGAEQAISNAQNLTTVYPSKLDLTKFHTFGLLWTPDAITYYCDQVAVLTMPNPGVVDPHYLLLSMDVSDHAGDPATGVYPASFMVDYVRAWALP